MRSVLWLGFLNQEKNWSWSASRSYGCAKFGEPGTQLTMRVKHYGGVVMSDVTQGLPRVEELFEMRTPKNLAAVSEITGKVKIETNNEGHRVHIKNTKIKPIESQEYFVPLSADIERFRMVTK